MKRTMLFFGFALLTGFLCTQGALAAPIAPKAAVTKDGKMLNYGFAGPCPEQKAVGVSAFPGSVCYKAAALSKKTAFVDLMTAAKPAKVADWYGKHLNGWTRTKAVSGEIVFTPPGERTNSAIAAFTDVHVSVKRLSKGMAKLKKMFYTFKGTPATVISISYSREAGGK